jgi:hypothetical protein
MTGEEEERRIERATRWPLEFLLILSLILFVYVFASVAWGECQP